MIQIPKKLEYATESSSGSSEFDVKARINQLIDVLHELTSRIDIIAGNQLEMKLGYKPGNISLNGMKLDDVDVKEQPKRRPQHFFQIDPVDGYQIVSYGFETREAAEAYKAKLLSDNAQV